jgi:hypothetical protein
MERSSFRALALYPRTFAIGKSSSRVWHLTLDAIDEETRADNSFATG